jgi:hypothetical protein
MARSAQEEEKSELRLYLILETVAGAIAFLPAVVLPYLTHSTNALLTLAWTTVPFVIIGALATGWVSFSGGAFTLTRVALLLPLVWIGGLAITSLWVS